MQVSAEMRVPGETAQDGRTFIIRELVNSFHHGAPLAAYSAAALVAAQGDHLEPDLTTQLQRSIGGQAAPWARVLASMVLSYPGQPSTLAGVRAGNMETDLRRFHGFPLAQTALRHLPAATAETLVWQSLMSDLSSLADEPYHPLFSYSSSFPLHSAVAYLARHSDNAVLVDAVKAALREDRAGSSFLAARLIDKGQKDCLLDALDRAMKVVRRPAANGDDLSASLRLVLEYGTEEQRRQLNSVAVGFKDANRDYAAFLQQRLAQSARRPL